jgi:YebC/PmpR family DNA-binding regulatory protein
MSGHSKWATIKRSKGVADAKRGAIFTKLMREIMVAARQGGGSTESNFRLRLAVQKARDNSMPMDNIERAIKKGTGESGAGSLQEMTMEGYGPKGVAIIVAAMTDNRNRTVSEIRSAFSKHGGNLSDSGGVSWMFENKGVIGVDTTGKNADDIALTAIDAGADDVKEEKDYLEIYTKPQKLEIVRKTIEPQAPVVSSEIQMIPTTTVMLEEKEALQTMKLIDHLEELDDVQKVYSNADFSDAVMEKVRAQLA